MCKEDLKSAKENFLIAAMCDTSLILFTGKAALAGFGGEELVLRALHFSIVDLISNQFETFFSGSTNASVMFIIGRALKGHIDMEKKKIFCTFAWVFNSLIRPSNQAIPLKSKSLVSQSSHRFYTFSFDQRHKNLHRLNDFGGEIWKPSTNFEAPCAFRDHFGITI